MGRAEIVGEIAVEVTADPTGFAAKLTAAMKAAAAKASKSKAFQPVIDDAEKAASQAGKKFGTTFEREASKITNRRSGGGFFSRLFGGSSGASKASNEAKKAAGGFASLLESMVGLIPGGEGVIKMFSSLGLSAIPASISAIVAIIGVVAALIVEIVALLGWLAQLVGIFNVLPASIAVVLAVIAPLIIAFQGVGQAIAAVASGDLEKINKSLKGLTPSARAFVREAALLKPVFTGIRKSVQEAFFAPVKGDLSRVVASLGPSIKRGLTGVAGILGTLTDRLAKGLANPQVAAGIDAVFKTVGNILAGLAGPGGKFLSSFGKAIIAGLPAVEKLAGIFGGFIDKFGQWITDSIESGKFEKWIDKAIVTAGELKDLVVAIIDWFRQLFADLDGEGESTIQAITDTFRKWTEMLKDPGSKRALKGLILLFDVLGTSIMGVLTALGFVAGAIGTVVSWLQTAYNWFKKVLGIGTSGQIHGKADQAIQDAGRRNLGNAFQKIPHFAAGGIQSEPGVAAIAETGPEAIVPLTNPARAAQVMDEAGLTGLMYSGGGGPSIRVYLGTREITDIVKVIVDGKLTKVANSVAAGTREA
jgi:hypothetical protein